MAQSGFTPIQLYFSTTGAAVPSAGNLANGELALNITDGRLFYKDNGGVVQVLATKAGASGDVVGPGSSTDNALVRFDSTTGKLVQNSVGILDDSGNLSGLATVTATSFAGALNGTVGATTPNTGAFTTLSASGALTLSGGTANGVAYLNGSKVLTSGSALTFDGTNLDVVAAGTLSAKVRNTSSSATASFEATNTLGTVFYGINATGPIIYTANALPILFWTNNAEGMRLTSSGNLGIGTTSPGYRLHTSINSATIGARFETTGSATESLIDFKDPGTTADFRVRIGSNGDNLRFYAGGATRATIDASGNLGIGTSSPTSALDVRGAATASVTIGRTSNAGVGSQPGSLTFAAPNASGTARTWNGVRSVVGNATAGSEAASLIFSNQVAGAYTDVATLDSSGALGLGVTPSAWPTSTRAIETPTGAFYSFASGTTSNFYMMTNAYFNGTNNIYKASNFATQYLQSAGQHIFYTAPSGTAGNAITFTQAMTLNASGSLLVGRTAAIASERLNVEGSNTSFIGRLRNTSATTPSGWFISYTAAAPNDTANQFLRCDDNAATRAEIRSNGGLANYSGNNVNLSDRREKTNFAPAGEYLSKICAIPVQTFNYIDQNVEDDPGTTLGVVAQDVQAVAPELVMESNWGTEEEPKMRLSVYQTDLQYALMKALQELKAEFDAYKATHP